LLENREPSIRRRVEEVAPGGGPGYYEEVNVQYLAEP